LALIAVWKSALSVALAGICAHGSLLLAKITAAAQEDYASDLEAYNEAKKIQKKKFKETEREERIFRGLPLRGLDMKEDFDDKELPPVYDDKNIKQLPRSIK
jgi:hypothetical protein